MKKLLCLSLVAVCLFGCSSKEEKLPVAVCKREEDNGMLVMNQTIELEYDGKEAVKQTQVTEIKTESDYVYQQLESGVKDAKAVYDGMEGASYKIEENKEDLMMIETITLNYNKMDKEDLAYVANVKTDNGDNKFTYIDVDKSIERLKGEGFTCEK